jgi:predicted RNA-binding protein with TRAM domain
MRRDFGRGDSDGGNFRVPPVREGEELDVAIEAVGEKGDGIAKKSGFVIFVPGAKAGQNVKIKVTKVLRKVAFAEVVGEASAAPKSQKKEEPKEDEEEEEFSNAESAPAAESPGEEEFTEDFGMEEETEE